MINNEPKDQDTHSIKAKKILVKGDRKIKKKKTKNERSSFEEKGSENQESLFEISKYDIKKIFDTYDTRNFDEDLILIEKLGGEKGLIKKLETSFNTGLSNKDENDLQRRAISFDDNTKSKKELKSYWKFVVEGFEDKLMRILIFTGIVEIIIGSIPAISEHNDWIQGISVIMAVIIVILVGSITNYLKEKKFLEIAKKSDEMKKITLKRDGSLIETIEDVLLVGDIVKLNYGNIIAGDGILLEAHGIKCDESSLTGETDLMEKRVLAECIEAKNKFLKENENQEKSLVTEKKTLPSPLLYANTQIEQGNGWMLILRVGKNSEKGKIEATIEANQENEKTPLQEKLEIIADDISYFGYISAIFTLIVLFIRFGVDYVNNKPNNVGIKIVSIFVLCISIVVVAIPEGLPLAVTLVLSFSITKMTEDNNMVRKLQSCETMGGANYICTDKTGTLTKNLMRVHYYFDNNKNVNMSKYNDGDIAQSNKFFSEEYFKCLKIAVSNNIEGEFEKDETYKNSSKTDIALIEFLKVFKVKIFKTRSKYYPKKDVKKFPFSSERKKMTTILESSEFPTGIRVITKGASEIVLRSVKFYLDAKSNTVIELNEKSRKKFEQKIKSYADMALRTIIIAYKDITTEELSTWREVNEAGKNQIEESNFTMIGLFGIRDPLREGVPEAVLNCKKAGIRVIMVTGDNLDTAVAISKDCNIIEESDNIKDSAMLGQDFFKLVKGLKCESCNKVIDFCKCARTKDEASRMNTERVRKEVITELEIFREKIKNLRVLARSRPEDKYLLVTGLRQLDNVVAVTGDGTNDAPALSKSNVGFAMGIQGTDIAKNSADIIILDDNFATIIKAVSWGRNIFNNIRKFMQFQLSVNISGVMLVFITSAIGNSTPLTAVQMLWLNLLMDSLGSLTLATQPPDPELLKEKPYNKNEHIISPLMMKNIIFHSAFQFSVLLYMIISLPNIIFEDNTSRKELILNVFNCYGMISPLENFNNKTQSYYILNGLGGKWSGNFSNYSNSCLMYYKNIKFNTSVDSLYTSIKSNYGGFTHLTMIFNSFVIYTLFNQINSRVIGKLNIFYKLHENMYFMIIWIFEVISQVLIVQFGSTVFSCVNDGLTIYQWGICLGFGSVSFIVHIIQYFIPLERFIEYIRLYLQIRKNRTKIYDGNVESQDADSLNDDNRTLKIRKSQKQSF